MNQKSCAIGVSIWLICFQSISFGQTLIKSEKTTEQERKTRSSALPKLRTIFYTNYKPSSGGKVYVPASVTLHKVDFKYANSSSPPFVVEQKLFRVDEESGIHAIYPSSDFGQVIASFQHADFSLIGMEINDLEWISAGGTKKKRLTKDQGGYHNVVWSPDQKTIAYASRQGVAKTIDINKYVKWAVYTQNVKTGKRTKLFEEKMASSEDAYPISPPFLRWLSPTQLLYPSSRPEGLYLLGTTGKPPIRLTKDAFDEIDLDAHFAFQEDYLAHKIQVTSLPSDPVALTKPQTWSALKPTQTFVFPNVLPTLILSPDRHTAAMWVSTKMDDATSVLILLDLKTRAVRFVGTSEKAYGVQWSKDGNWLTLLTYSPTPDPQDGSYYHIVAVPVPTGEGVPFDQFDWKQNTPLKWTKLFAFSGGVVAVAWSE